MAEAPLLPPHLQLRSQLLPALHMARTQHQNGYPWGSSRDLPSELALWLIGLGVEPIWNPPARPTRNAKVERCNGLTQQWGELHTCTDCKQAARALARIGRIQREEYPAICGRIPKEKRSSDGRRAN